MESGKQTEFIYTDFSKAFNSLNNPVLIEILLSYNISDYLILLDLV